MAARAAVVALCLVTPCQGISVSQPLDSMRQLGQTGRQSRRISSEAGDQMDHEWGRDVVTAERLALEAKAAAEKAEEESGDNLTVRQVDAIDRHANAEFSKEVGLASKLDKVVASMDREGDAATRVITKLERQTRHVTATTGEDQKKKLAIERDLRKLDQADEDEAKSEDKVLRAADKKEHALEKKEADDFNRAEKEMREAKKAVDSELAKEREYAKKRTGLEAATSSRLWKEANAMRNESADATLSEEDILRLLDISFDNLTRTQNTVTVFGENGNQTGAWFDQRLDGIRHKSAASSAHLVEAIKHKISLLRDSHFDYDNHQLMHYLVTLLNEIKGEVIQLQQASAQVNHRIDQWNQANPEKMSAALSLALNGVTGNVELRNHFYSIDTTRLGAQATGPETCGVLRELVLSKWETANASLALMKKGIDNLAKVVPSALKDMPNASKMMENRTNVLLNMAYAEQIALNETATSISLELAPLIVHRFHCALSGAARLGGTGAAAAAAAAAALLLSQ